MFAAPSVTENLSLSFSLTNIENHHVVLKNTGKQGVCKAAPADITLAVVAMIPEFKEH